MASRLPAPAAERVAERVADRLLDAMAETSSELYHLGSNDLRICRGMKAVAPGCRAAERPPSGSPTESSTPWPRPAT